MPSDKSTPMIVLSILFLLVGQTVYAQIYNPYSPLTPPTGNSPKAVAKTIGGYQVYTCVNGAWVAGKGYATLVDATTKTKMGDYTYTGGYSRTFSMINTGGDLAESGYSNSMVTGRILASASGANSNDLPTLLLVANSHQNDGEASTVSYIQFYNVLGGASPGKDKCSRSKIYSVTVSFAAEFCFWSQDSLPPTVPQQLAVKGQVLEGFYAEGFVRYGYNGSGWSMTGRVGTLHTLPGTPAIGQFSENGGVGSWHIYDPSGFTVYAKFCAPQVQTNSNGCAWTLSATTSQTPWSLGHCSYVQAISTRGGLPPTSGYKPLMGAVQNVSVSFIVWLYS